MHPGLPWLAADGPLPDLVISSRVRLARNLAGVPPVGEASAAHRTAVVVAVLATLANAMPATPVRMDALNPKARRRLTEEQRIAPDFGGPGLGAALALVDRDRTVTIFEHDHVRVAALSSGLALDSALALAELLVERVAGRLEFAPERNALRASVHMHLPGLRRREALEPLAARLAPQVLIRAAYPCADEALGEMFEVFSLGATPLAEGSAVTRLREACERVADLERDARAALLEDPSLDLAGQIRSAFAGLGEPLARSHREVLDLLSLVRFGAASGLLPPISFAALNLLAHRFGPAALTDARER